MLTAKIVSHTVA